MPLIDATQIVPSIPETNHALQLNVTSHAETGVPVDPLERGDFTLAARFVLEHPAGNYAWIFGESGGGTFIAGKDSRRPWLHVDLGSGVRRAETAIAAGTWKHFALVATSSEVALFLDGERVRTVPRWERWVSFFGRGRLRLGGRGDDYWFEQFIGLLDDVWVFAEALTDDEVGALAKGQPPRAGAKVAAAFTFEPGSPMPSLVGEARVIAAPSGEPVPATEANHATPIAIPIDGEWRVTQASEEALSHHGYAAFAFDFIPADQSPCWGRPVVSPAAGRVVFVRDGAPDAPNGPTSGNTVHVEHARGEISEFVHLKRGSIRVAVGDRLERGVAVGECGSSGTAGPHLHWGFLVSNAPIMTRPVRFSDYEVRDENGVWHPGSGRIRTGEVVRNVAQPLGR